MPKSRRGKKFSQSQKRKNRLSQPAPISQQPVAAQAVEAVPRLRVPPAPPKTVSPAVKPATALYPYIGRELMFIGILAGIMLAIIIVLGFVLS
jgi:hypothetical protein